MITKFVNRESELSFLNERYKGGSFELIPIYGRRRVGKTELIKQFIDGKKAIYFLASAGTKKENIERFKETAKEFIDLKIVRDEWEDIFQYITNNMKERLIIVIDEFPYLVESEVGLSSIFQRIIDLHLKNSNLFLILCGSSLSMMYKEVLSYRAPLYGRRTGQVEVKPLRFVEAARFFDKPIEEIIKIFSICGGVPAYLAEFVDKKPLEDLISEKILSKGSLLREEPLFLLREEFRDPRVYVSILSSLSFGYRKLGEIINYCGLESKTGITPYLQNLENLGYTHRELPVTEKPVSKKGLYFINDTFFNFWFRMVRKNFDAIEKDIGKAIKKIKKDFDSLIPFVFEEICKDVLWYLKPIEFNKIGRWWYQDKEIDIVCLNETEKEALFIECKWSDLKEGETRKILTELKEKSKSVDWKRQKESFGLIAKKVVGKEALRKDGFFVWDLEDLEKITKKF